MKPRRKPKSNPMTLKRLYDCAETLKAWKQRSELSLDRCCPGWKKQPMYELMDNELDQIQDIGLIQAVRVSLLKEIKMWHIIRRIQRTRKRSNS